MAVLDATVGTATANSYATVAEADTYFAERTNVNSWDGATTQKAVSLIMATRRIDQESFKGTRTNPSTDVDTTDPKQALKWPRTDVETEDGLLYDPAAIPRIVKYATFEMALRILNDNTTDTFADTGLEQFEEVTVGSLTVKPRPTFRAGTLPEVVRRLLRPVLLATGSGVRLLRA